MSFAFGFSGDDIEDEESGQLHANEAAQSTADEPPNIPPQRHQLRDLLRALPSQISFNHLQVPGSQVIGNDEKSGELTAASVIPRRSLFDIRTQLMAEADPEENDNDTLLAGLDQGDLTSGIYEGGFKTWECAVDLASLTTNVTLEDRLNVIELGAGSAIPSMVLLQRALKTPPNHQKGTLHLTLCDYNEHVLKLATAPNVFLTARENQNLDIEPTDGEDLDIEDIDDDLVATSLQSLQKASISVDMISGAWGDDFLQLLRSSPNNAPSSGCKTLILASETIYSPRSIKSFTRTLLQILQHSPQDSRAWVAAKKIYFGVGGGVDEFVREVEFLGGRTKTLLDVRDAGVGRVVLEVTLALRV